MLPNSNDRRPNSSRRYGAHCVVKKNSTTFIPTGSTGSFFVDDLTNYLYEYGGFETISIATGTDNAIRVPKSGFYHIIVTDSHWNYDANDTCYVELSAVIGGVGHILGRKTYSHPGAGRYVEHSVDSICYLGKGDYIYPVLDITQNSGARTEILGSSNSYEERFRIYITEIGQNSNLPSSIGTSDYLYPKAAKFYCPNASYACDYDGLLYNLASCPPYHNTLFEVVGHNFNSTNYPDSAIVIPETGIYEIITKVAFAGNNDRNEKADPKVRMYVNASSETIADQISNTVNAWYGRAMSFQTRVSRHFNKGDKVIVRVDCSPSDLYIYSGAATDGVRTTNIHIVKLYGPSGDVL